MAYIWKQSMCTYRYQVKNLNFIAFLIGQIVITEF